MKIIFWSITFQIGLQSHFTVAYGPISNPCNGQLSEIQTKAIKKSVFSSTKCVLRTVYTPGHPINPHGCGPNETMPAKKINGFDRFELSINIKGPPESPRHESLPGAPPAHSWLFVNGTRATRYCFVHSALATPFNSTFCLKLLKRAKKFIGILP